MCVCMSSSDFLKNISNYNFTKRGLDQVYRLHYIYPFVTNMTTTVKYLELFASLSPLT